MPLSPVQAPANNPRHLMTSPVPPLLPRFSPLLCGALAIIASSPSRAASFHPIGNLGVLTEDRTDRSPFFVVGYGRSIAEAISADGSTVVGSSLLIPADNSVNQRAIVWTREDGIRSLGVLDGYSTSEATAVSDDGSVIAGSSNAGLDGQEACTWTLETGLITGLKPVSDPERRHVSRAYAISGDGSVVAGEWLSTAVMRWDAVNGMVRLGDLPGGHVQGKTYDLSQDGSVMVGYGASASGLEAFRWTEATGMVGLGDLPGGSFFSIANGVSADGSIVVGIGKPTDVSGENEAFVWTAEDGMQGLGDLPGGPLNSSAQGISADGRIIVGYATDDEEVHGVLWDETGRIHRVVDVLDAWGVDHEGWLLGPCYDVSADGMVIVGIGLNPDGNVEGWVVDLTDTEPPVIHDATADPGMLWPPNGKQVPITFSLDAKDDSGSYRWGIMSVDCSEDCDESDIVIESDGEQQHLFLRATRDGRSRSGRTYSVELAAWDEAGNLSDPYWVTITVPHDRRR